MAERIDLEKASGQASDSSSDSSSSSSSSSSSESDSEDESEKRDIKIFVKTSERRTLALDVKPTDTVDTLKVKIQEKEGIPLRDQRVFYSTKQLKDGARLQEYNIQSQATLHLEGRRLSGDY